MAGNRTNGILGISANFEPQVAGAFDARAVVPTQADLLLATTWEANDGGTYIYVGMTVTVAEDSTPANNGVYILLNVAGYTNINNWKFVGSGGAGNPGATGAQGAAGEIGASGAQGAAGGIGATGAQGAAGGIGASGAQGAAGGIGATGAGATGAQGSAGEIGASGAQGAAGEIGATGPQGDDANTLVTTNTQSNNYTLVLTDRDKIVEISNASTRTVTVPPNSSVAFSIGSQIMIARGDTGSVQILEGAGVTIDSSNNHTYLQYQYSGATLIKKSTNGWWLFGDLTTII